ncbi:MAG: type III-B CRISPR-associated protein Cas10/Cmr2 [Acidobacteria bacterium]|nr:type III-B CRISPR-associated protein Cas10/Cmr2 [Acidobacteriota bacterium]
MPYLMSISIGPVQEFIASARRSRDLWFGSWLLSEISKAAAKKIADENGELIFPAIKKKEDLYPIKYEKGIQTSGTNFNVVNKIVALIDTDPKQFCEGEKNGIRQAMQDRLEEIRVDAYNGIKNKSHIDEAKAKLQVADLIEFYWAAHPVKGNSDYVQARDEAEALLAARKNLRDFVQPTAWSDPVPKSSLDGLRESVIKESVYKAVQDGGMTQESLRLQLGVRNGERLCGVGLLKRHGNRQGDDSFFSTSHIAALPIMNSLRTDNIAENRKAFNNYIEKLKELGVKTHDLNSVPVPEGTLPHPVLGRRDGHLLFGERLSEFFDTNAKDGTQAAANKKNLEQAKSALSDLLKDKFKIKAPKPYFALLHADGDRMGEAIDAQETKEKHQAISSKLSEFAGKVRTIVEGEHGGSLVYAGGDDVLAFLPLHEALFCARKLANEFRDTLAEFKKDEGKSPTLSVGIAVGHHLDALQDTLNLAREAETAAKKQVKDKNALAIIVSKRSGADWLVKGSWCDSSANEEALDNRLNYFIYLHLAEALPRGVGYELRNVALRLGGVKELEDALREEALRIIKRKRSKDGKLKKEVFERMERYVRDKELSIEDLAYQLIAVRPFAEAMKQAGIDAKTFARKAGFEELAETGNK